MVRSRCVRACKRHLLCLLQLVFLGASVAFANTTSSDVAVGDRLSVTLVNTSADTNWLVSLCSGTDTIYSGSIDDTLRFSLAASGDYSLACYRADTSVGTRFFIRSDYVTSAAITITCSNTSVLSSSSTLNEIGALYTQFSTSSYRSIHNFQTSKLSEEFASLKQKVLKLQHDISGATHDSSAAAESLDRIIVPITQYIDNVSSRWSALKNLPGKHVLTTSQLVQKLLALPSIQAINDEGIRIESAESHLLFDRISYQVAVTASHWFEIEFPGITERGKMSVDVARLVQLLVGSRATCQAAYGLFARSTGNMGSNFNSCDDPLPSYILELAASDSGAFCRKAEQDLRAVCKGLSISELNAFNAVDPTGKDVIYHLDRDSVYVLHFWGTWCVPCIQQEKSIHLVGDTLYTMRCRMLHLASDISRNSPVWQKYVARFPHHQYFVGNDANSVIRLLAVNTYPSYIVIGQGNKILNRLYDYRELTKFVSGISAQK